MQLAEKVSIITGATSGIGLATAMLFAQEGAIVIIVARNKTKGQQLINKIKQTRNKALFIQADVRFAKDCQRVVAQTVSTYGRLDILFNNAGVYYPNTVLECTEKEWDLQIDTSLKGTFLMSKHTLPIMISQRSGVIINMASGWGIMGGDKAAAYCAAKGGVVLLTKAMAIDHGKQGIRINVLCPGDVDTPMLIEDARLRNMDWGDHLKSLSTRPLGRIGTPEEIAKAALFLASDDSSYMTGATLVVDGGGTAG